MRIAMVSEHASPLAPLGGVDAGGQNVHVAELARGLGRLGHEVAVYTRRDDPDLPTRVATGAGVTVVHVPAGPALPLPKEELLPFMDEFGDWMGTDWDATGVPDVVHAHHWMSGLAATRAAAPRRVPVAVTFHALGAVRRRHQGADDTSPRQRVELEAELARQADLIVATCADEVAELAMMGAGAPVRVVPCGVDTAFFTPGERPDPAGPARLLLVGRMVPRKGFEVAVRAVAKLPGVQLVIVGGPVASGLADDAQAHRLMSLASELGVADRVVLTGRIPHERMPAVYRAADVVLATAWYEPFGITPLEAGACGRPVVATAVGGMLDTVEDGVTGRLVPPRDVDALAGAVDVLLRDRGALAAMGAAARERITQRYDWAIVAQGTEDALSELVTPGQGAAGACGLWLAGHVGEVRRGVRALVAQAPLLQSWGRRLATHLSVGGRLLVAGNGGSAAQAQHLTAELVGRFEGERPPMSAIALTVETSSLTAIVNDYGSDEIFARQVSAHGRPGDILLLLSTSGHSGNVLRAAERARALGLRVWAMTGRGPNPLADCADQALVIPVPSTSAVQELHLMAVHALCAAVDACPHPSVWGGQRDAHAPVSPSVDAVPAAGLVQAIP